jgi:hypothetical protein
LLHLYTLNNILPAEEVASAEHSEHDSLQRRLLQLYILNSIFPAKEVASVVLSEQESSCTEGFFICTL